MLVDIDIIMRAFIKIHIPNVIDIMWPISQSYFHVSCLCLLK